MPFIRRHRPTTLGLMALVAVAALVSTGIALVDRRWRSERMLIAGSLRYITWIQRTAGAHGLIAGTNGIGQPPGDPDRLWRFGLRPARLVGTLDATTPAGRALRIRIEMDSASGPEIKRLTAESGGVVVPIPIEDVEQGRVTDLPALLPAAFAR